MKNLRRGEIIVDRAELLKRLAAERAQGKTIVYANGCFDLIHVGHIRYLTAAAQEGDVLVVAINSDASARKLKGPGRPATCQSERMELLAAIDCVDYVTMFEGTDCAELVGAIRPDVHAKGTDWSAETLPERAMVESYGGRIAIVGDPKDHSSTAMFQQMQQADTMRGDR
jgi:rfaE bifunctional protein nucleotidyltransferase chain/domain